MNLSFPGRLSGSQKPLHSQPRIFTRSRRRLLNTYAHEANGSKPRACYTSTTRPLMLNLKPILVRMLDQPCIGDGEIQARWRVVRAGE